MGSGMNIQARHLTKSALQDIVEQLLSSDDETGRAIMNKLGKQAKQSPPKNDLADLHEEMHGNYNAPMVQDDDEDNVSNSQSSDDFDDDNGVKTARVKGPPSQKPTRNRGGDEDVLVKRGGGQIRPGNPDDDEDMPTSRNVPRVNAGSDEDLPNSKPRKLSQRGDEDMTGSRPRHFSQRGDEDMVGPKRRG